MCYFHQTRWSCGYWRWGRFHEQCNREYRIGETCGLMLVYETEQHPKVCALCCQLQKKFRRYEKMWRDVARWRREGGKPATVERTSEEMHIILKQIYRLKQDHYTRCQPSSLGRITEPLLVPQTGVSLSHSTHQERGKNAIFIEGQAPITVSIDYSTPKLPSLSSPSSSSSSSSSPAPSPSSDVAPVFGYDLGAWALAANNNNYGSESEGVGGAMVKITTNNNQPEGTDH